MNPQPSTRRLLLWAGPLLCLVGIALFPIMMTTGYLGLPWYTPVLAILGTVCVVLALGAKKSGWRYVNLAFCSLLAVTLTYFIFFLPRLPNYEGPAVVGQTFPAFVAKRADGAEFTQASLVGEQNTVVVFYRGKW